MEEHRAKLSFSITPSKPKTPNPTTACPAAFSVPAAAPNPAPRFITTFDPSQTLAAPAFIIAPLPNSRNPSTVPPTAGGGPAFVFDAAPDNNNPSPSSSAGYGVAVRGSAERKLAAQDAAAARRFKQDMAVLPDIQGADEYDEVPVEGFGAALLAGYGWKEGSAIGRDKSKGDVKVVERGRRAGTTGLGADASDQTDSAAVRPVVRRSVRVLRDC